MTGLHKSVSRVRPGAFDHSAWLTPPVRRRRGVRLRNQVAAVGRFGVGLWRAGVDAAWNFVLAVAVAALVAWDWLVEVDP